MARTVGLELLEDAAAVIGALFEVAKRHSWMRSGSSATAAIEWLGETLANDSTV